MRAKVLTRGYPPCQLFLKPTVHRAVAQGFPPQFLPVSIIALWANCGGHCLGCLAAEVHITQDSQVRLHSQTPNGSEMCSSTLHGIVERCVGYTLTRQLDESRWTPPAPATWDFPFA